MRVNWTFPFMIAIAVGCSPAEDSANTAVVQDRDIQSVTIDNRSIHIDQCNIYEETQAGTIALYDFKGHERCYLMELDGNVRSFQSESGTVFPMGIPLESGENCQTSAYAIVYRDSSFYLSTKFYSRFQCETFNWPEKPFHVLASDAVQLPADNIAFEEAH